MTPALLRAGVAVAICLALLPLSAAHSSGTAPLRVGLVMDFGASTDGGIGQDVYEGFITAVKKLGLRGQVLEVSQRQDRAAALANFARRGFDLVNAGAHFQAKETLTMAARYPRTRFVAPDASFGPVVPRPSRNVWVISYRVEEAAYLAGFLAVKMEQLRPGPDMISSVGGFKIPSVDAFIAGYQAGARRANRAVRLLNDYSHNFADPGKCRTTALAQIGRGSGVVFDVAGTCGLGVLEAARERSVFGIGVDVDLARLGPHILTSVVKREARGILIVLQALAHGGYKGGSITELGLRERGVGLGKISPWVPGRILAQVGVSGPSCRPGESRCPRSSARPGP